MFWKYRPKKTIFVRITYEYDIYFALLIPKTSWFNKSEHIVRYKKD